MIDGRLNFFESFMFCVAFWKISRAIEELDDQSINKLCDKLDGKINE